MLTHHIALVSDTPDVDFADIKPVAAVLQKQVTRDFTPIWGVEAEVAAYRSLKEVPHGYWPIIIKDSLTRPEAAGYHENDLGEPYALVRLTADWSVTASHEMLELLADPWGRHMFTAPSLLHPGKRVKFLVEVSDPCSDAHYKVDKIAVSDFYTPRYFDHDEVSGVRYSHTGAITAPRQVLKGGYLTWHDPEDRKWFHRSWFDGASPSDGEVPIPAIVKGNIRATIDRHFGPARAAAKKG
jgi:hypothetical protein